jgi:hypothetical protein
MTRDQPTVLMAKPPLGHLLHWSGLCLLAVFLVNVLRVALPPALLQPAWVLQVFSSLREGAVIPLMGIVLLLLAETFAPDDRRVAASVRWARRLAVLLALLFALLLPLQVVVGLNLSSRDQQQQQRLLDQARSLARGVAEARDEAAMRKAIARLPGAPPLGEGRFSQPLEQVRQALLLQLNPQIKRIEETIAQLRLQAAAGQVNSWIGDGAIALIFAVAFAAIGQLEPARPTLLQYLGNLLQGGGDGAGVGRGLRGLLMRLRRGSAPEETDSLDWLESVRGNNPSPKPRPGRGRRAPRNPWTDRR